MNQWHSQDATKKKDTSEDSESSKNKRNEMCTGGLGNDVREELEGDAAGLLSADAKEASVTCRFK